MHRQKKSSQSPKMPKTPKQRNLFSRKNIIAICSALFLGVGGRMIENIWAFLAVTAWILAGLVLVYLFFPFEALLRNLLIRRKYRLSSKWIFKLLSVIPVLVLGSIAFLTIYQPLVKLIENKNPELVIPKLQVKPITIKDSLGMTTMVIDILNYSSYVAKNITLDVKLGDNAWHKDKTKATNLNLINQLFSQDEELKTQMELYYDVVLLGELISGKKATYYVSDWNKDYLLNQHFYWSVNGKNTPINSSDTLMYQESQDWKKQINNSNGEPIELLIRTTWKNEIGKNFEQIVEYQLTCTILGIGKSYTFLPTGNVITDKQ